MFENIERFSSNIPKNRVLHIREIAEGVLIRESGQEMTEEQRELQALAGYILELTEGVCRVYS